MRRRLVVGFMLILMSGCAVHQTPAPFGLVPPAERAADLNDDQIRLLGVDRAPPQPLTVPFYLVPVALIGDGFDVLFIEPPVRFWAYITNDTPARAARDMLDATSADSRRYGILRLAEEAWARQSASECDLWASIAEHDPDYTVRAAAIRALNWARDDRHPQVYLDALKDDQVLVRLEGTKALANVPNAAAVATLLDRLDATQEASRDVRIAAADALRCYKRQEVAHALIDSLDSVDFGVAWQARQSLRLMTGYDFHYDQRAWLDYLSSSRQPFG